MPEQRSDVVVEGAHLLLELIPLALDFGKPLLRRHVHWRCMCVHRLHRHCVSIRLTDCHKQMAAAITSGLQFAAAYASANCIDGDAEMIGRLAQG